MSCGVAYRHGSDPALLWLWHELAAAALIGPLAWEPTYASINPQFPSIPLPPLSPLATLTVLHVCETDSAL